MKKLTIYFLYVVEGKSGKREVKYIVERESVMERGRRMSRFHRKNLQPLLFLVQAVSIKNHFDRANLERNLTLGTDVTDVIYF